jgi:YVTN family beta-propeller protein
MYVLDYGNSVQGTVYVVNGTSVVGTVNSGTSQVYCSDDGNYPIAYDPTDKMIYVSSNDFSSASANGNVSVISGTTRIANVTVGKGPCAIAFDPADGYIYVANSYDNTVSIISGTTVVGTVVVGSSPSALAYDSHNQDMYVVSQSGVSVLSGGTVVGTISLGYSVSSSIAFNPSNNEMYVTSFSCCTTPIDVNLSAINGTKMVGTVRVGSTSVYGASIAYDPADNDMYVVPWGNSTGTTIVVVSGLTVIGTIREGPYSVASAFDPATNEMFVTSTYSVLALSGTSVDYNITGIPGPNALAFDTSNNYMYVTYGSHVALIGPVTPFDYTLSISPSSGTVTSGQSIMSTVTATLTAGTAQSVMLGVSAISPLPAVCQSSSGPSPCGNLVFSPTSITPSTAGATSTLTLSTTSVLPVGTYAITISGIPGGLPSSSAVFTVTVTAPSPGKSTTSVLVTCSPSSINVGRFTTCTATVTGNYPSGTVTFASSSTTGTFATSSCTLSAGACSATYVDSATASLTATITASYAGDTNNNSNNGSSSLNISKPAGVIAVGATTSTLTNGGFTANQVSATGISVTITGSTASNGTPVGVSTQTLNAPNSGIPAPNLSSPSYYDVLVTGISSGNAQVCISFSSATSTTMQYWEGTSWTSASSITVSGGKVCGTIPVSALTGTNIVLGNTIESTPPQPTIFGLTQILFYGIIGGLSVIVLVAIAVIVRRRGKRTPSV